MELGPPRDTVKNIHNYIILHYFITFACLNTTNRPAHETHHANFHQPFLYWS